jgi:tetratricopeptide (TPR) repeat protein
MVCHHSMYVNHSMSITACQSQSSDSLASNFTTADAAVSEALALVLGDLGTKLKACGSTQEAIERYQQALCVCPTCATVHYNMGVVTSEMKQYDEALQHYERAVKLQPGNPQAHCNMGVIYKERGDIHKAITCYERALAASPNFVIVKVCPAS